MRTAVNNPVIEIKDLYKSFGDKKVLQGFNLEVANGESVVVLGKSGSGKSVLIKCIIGLLMPDQGTIKVFGEEVHGFNHEELDKMRTRVGFLFQANALYDSMTVRENLEFPLRRHWIKATRKEVDNMVMEALDNVGLKETVDMMPADLSGGMRKRIALARTLIMKPEIILYDEPTTGLDPITAREIGELMNNVKEKYKTSSIIISHDMNCIQLTASRIVVLIDGVCHAQGTFDELQNSVDIKVRQFFE